MNEIPKIGFYKKSNPDLEFEILTLENLFSRSEQLNNFLKTPHRVDFHHIMYITEGSGTHSIDFKRYSYSPHTLIFISKGQVHSFDADRSQKGFVILFTDAFISKNLVHSDVLSLYRLYNYHLYDPILDRKKTVEAKLCNTVSEIYEEYQHTNEFAKEEILRVLLKYLLLKIERVKQALTPKVKNSDWLQIFNSFKALVENRYTKSRNALDYSQWLHISYKHLNEVCKSITGNSAKKFIDIYVVLEMKRYLATSDLSINELGYTLGFDEATNLVKFFKRHTSQSPSEFRKLVKK